MPKIPKCMYVKKCNILDRVDFTIKTFFLIKFPSIYDTNYIIFKQNKIDTPI